MQSGETTEQFGPGQLNAAWNTGVDLYLSGPSSEPRRIPLRQAQLTLGGPGSDIALASDLPAGLWKLSYRAGQYHFVCSDRAWPGQLNGSNVLYAPLSVGDRLVLQHFHLQILGAGPALGFLEAFSPPHLGTRWALYGSSLALGREQADVILEDSTVSRKHAEIFREAEGFCLRALSERSQTLVNGKPLLQGEVALLQAGDLINLGRQVLRFTVTASSLASGLRVLTLGGFQAELAGQPLETSRWQGSQVQHLFVFLCAFRGTPCSEERLIDQLWPGEDVSRKRLQNVISILRNLLRPLSNEPILREPGGLRLHPDLPLWLDLEELRRLIQSERSPAVLESEVRRLYRGTFLPGCQLPWAGVLRAQLEQSLVAVLLEVAQQSLGQQRWDEAESLLRLCLEVEPWQVEGWTTLLESLRLQGKEVERNRLADVARQQFQRAGLPFDAQQTIADKR